MKQQIRETIKNNLQKLSKEELVDTLTDIFITCSAISMTCSAISMTDAVSNIQCVTPPISPYVQRINDQFASIQQSITGLEK